MDKNELLAYFIETTNTRFDKIEARFDKIDEKLDDLSGFRWKIIGSSITVNTIITLVVALLAVYFAR